MKRCLWAGIILSCLIFRAYGEVLIAEQGSGALFENEKIKGDIDAQRACFSIKEVKGSGIKNPFTGYLETKSGQKSPFGLMDGSANGQPMAELKPEGLQREFKVLEEGPVRAVAVFKARGVYREDAFLPGYTLNMERRFTVYSRAGLVATVTTFQLDRDVPENTMFLYPHIHPYLLENNPFKFVTSAGTQGNVPDPKDTPEKRQNWISEKVTGGWLQLFYSDPEGKSLSWIFLWPETQAKIGGDIYEVGKGNDATKVRNLYYNQNWGGKKEIVFPLTCVFTREVKEASGSFIAEYYYKRYNPDGTPRGIEAAFTSPADKSGEGLITIREKLGLARTNTVLEVTAGLNGAGLDKAKITDIAGGADVLFQAGKNTRNQDCIVFELPQLKPNAEIKLRVKK